MRCSKPARGLPSPFAGYLRHPFGDAVPIRQGVDKTSRAGETDFGEGGQFGRRRGGSPEIVDQVLGQVAAIRVMDGRVEEGHQRRTGHVLSELVQVLIVEADAATVFPHVGPELVEGLRPRCHGQGEKVVVELLRDPEYGLRL